ncbi:sporulation related protein [Bacillus oleivorans]|uniref:Sporulation related protein n=1 Tax=Bacillus oleivorans TaxID=1448271 RepID=A0A285CH98_9BACI|nr:peptidoglycan DD-metalloendopeptidase family protein [Bacillus oleivorans]SNX66964.1 sporulation related protein [Bacillus oleivorans]
MVILFIYPTDVERVTSGFRTSSRPNHHGVDFAEPGTHEIYATADGTVSRSYVSSSYGEAIFIVHVIDGQTWESVYAHLREGSRRVKEGDRVRQGQVIGIMGNTGDSSGQHLHFELHRGRWNINKTNAVNPLSYLQREETDTQRYRLVTGTFPNAESFVEALRKMRSRFNWVIYEKADSTDFNPNYRIVTGTFTGKASADRAAQQVRDAFGWIVYIQEA